MSAFHNVRSSASSAVLKLLSEFDQSVKSVADLKTGSILLNLFLELGLAQQRSSQSAKNPFQFMKKSIKKCPDKDFFQRINLDQCEKGNEAELLYFSSCLLYRWHSQRKENCLQASDVLSDQETKILWSVWLELEPHSFSSEPSRSSMRPEPLKEYNFSPKAGSPLKRIGETPSGLKKEIHKKEICITNLRSLLDEEQDRIVELLQAKKDHEYQISVLEKVIKGQKEKLENFSETSKLSHDIEDFQRTVQSLTRDKEKLLLKVKELKDTKKEITVLETENEDLRNMKDSLNAKVSNLEGFNKRLTNELQDWQKKQCESSLLQKRLDILHEELKVKEDTISDLNNMIAVYQDKLDVQKSELSHENMDSSDCGEVVGLVCSSFQNTSCELTSLQNEVNNLQHQNDSLETKLKEVSESYQKSGCDNAKLEKEVETLQKLVDHLNSEIKDNQFHITSLDNEISVKDCSIVDLTSERNNLLAEVKKLISEITGLQDQLVRVKDEQEKSLTVIEHLENEVRKGNGEVECLRNDLLLTNCRREELQEQVSSLEEDTKTLRAEASAAISNNEKLFSEVQQLENSLALLKVMNAEQEQGLSSYKKDKSDLESALFTLQEKHTSLITSYETCSVEKDAVVSKLNELHNQYMQLQTEHENLQVSLNNFREENDRLQMQIINADSQNKRLLEITTQLNVEKSSLSEEVKNVQDQLSEVQCHSCLLQENIEELVSQKTDILKNVSILETKHTELTENYDTALRAIDDLNLELTSTKRELEVLTAIHNETKHNLSSIETEFDILLERYQAGLLQNKTCSEELKALQEQYSLATGKILERESKIFELNECMKAAAEENDTWSVKNETLTNEKTMYMEKSMQLEQEVTSLQQMRNILSEQIAELLDEKMLLQSRLKQSEDKVDANTSTCSISSNVDGDFDLNESNFENSEKDAIIKNLESQLSVTEERYKIDLNDKENEKVELSRRIEALLLDLKCKEKYLTFLELEKQQALEKCNTLSKYFEKKIENLQNDCKNESTNYKKKIKDLEQELESMSLLKENTVQEISEYKESLVALKEELEMILAEKSQVINALCEKEDSLKSMQETINEKKIANEEMAAIIEDKNRILASLEESLKLKSAQVEQLLLEVMCKTSELQKLAQVQAELNEARNNLFELENRYATNLDNLQKTKDSLAADNEKLNSALTCKTGLVEDLTSKLINTSKANDMLVAETVLKANELLSLQELLKVSASEAQDLKSALTSHEQNESGLRECVENLATQIELTKNRETELDTELNSFRNSLMNKEQLLLEANQKIEIFQDVAIKNEQLCKDKQYLEVKIGELETEIIELRKPLSRDENNSVDTNQKFKEGSVMFNNTVHNPALRQWLDQFDSLSQKIQEMRDEYPEKTSRTPEEISVPSISNFENNILTMISEHIHSWFTSTKFLFQENVNESELLRKYAKHWEPPSTFDQVSIINSENTQTEDPVIRVESKEIEPCKDCSAKADIEKELESKCAELCANQARMQLIEKKCDTKEREAKLYKEAHSMCQQKIADLKQHLEVQQMKYKEQVTQAKEQNNGLQTKLEDSRTKLKDTDKKYLDEMKIVHKKFQEKINLHNTTSKDLSQARMQLVNISKQNTELLEKCRKREDQLINANTSLKKQRLENESLKTELRNLQRIAELKQQENNLRRMSFIPNSSFMQNSISSTASGASSLNSSFFVKPIDASFESSVFIKPMLPASRFACDEEEGQFLDQSRNVSILKEGRVDASDISSKSRLEELQRRNTLCKPHLRTHYPVETQSMFDESTVCIKDITRTPQVAKRSVSQPLPSTTATSKAAGSQRKRKEWTQVPVDMSTPAKKTSTVVSEPSSGKTKNQTRKAPFYKVFSPFRKEKPKKFPL